MSVSHHLDTPVSNGSLPVDPWRRGQNPIRVLAISQYSDFGGAHNRIASLAPYCAAADIKVLALLAEGPGDAARRLMEAGVEVITRPLHGLRRTFNPGVLVNFGLQFWNDVACIRQLLRDRLIDLVQIHGLLYPHGAVAARLEGLPVVWQLNDQFLPSAIRRAFVPFVTRFADVVMTTGMSMARLHPGVTHLGERLVVFFPSVDVNFFRPDSTKRANARAELGLASDELVVGTIAHINPNKDMETFVQAAGALRRDFPKSRFVILGKTYSHLRSYTRSVWRQAECLGLRPGIELLQKEAGSRVADLAQCLDVFWLTSSKEGTPTALAEAMALGLPVVATDVGGVGEIVEDRITGFIVPPGDVDAFVDRTRRLFSERELGEQIGHRARQSVLERFTPDICARSHMRAYRRALDHHWLRAGGQGRPPKST
jgi:glycosyltransferase involved in cell wall biosynthesis